MTVLLAGGLVAIGLAVAVWSLAARRGRQVRDLREVLALRVLEPADASKAEETSHLLASAGLAAEKLVGQGSGLLGRVTRQLERSDWTLAPGEFLVVSLVVVVIGGLFGFALDGVGTAVPFGLVAGAVPSVLVTRSVATRRRRFDEQFPAVLDLIAASLEAGSSLPQALELIASEAESPSREEFGRVLAATRLGASLVEALAALSERIGSRDLDWTVQAITVQQRTGGRLAEILRVVATTMRDRAEVQRELQALTAEGRLSAYILVALPFLLAAFITVDDPHYLGKLFTTGIGLVMVTFAAVMMAIGAVVMSRIIRVEA